MAPARPVIVPELASTVPRALRVRSSAVWGRFPGDPLAPARWRAAAASWRTAARKAGASSEQARDALPGPRQGEAVVDDEQRLTWQLEGIGATAADLPALAGQARRGWPALFAPHWPGEPAPDAAPRWRGHPIA